MGDSITEGVGASTKENMYVEIVKSKLNIQVNNYGISGTRIARQTKPTDDAPRFDLDFQLRVNEMEKSDFLFVFGGTNDFGHGDALIGNINSNDPYTFCGGVNNLIESVLKQYSKDKVCFILPFHRLEENSSLGDGSKKIPTLPLSGYVDIMKNLLDKNNIRYINLFEIGPKYGNEYFLDAVHPNNKGHEYLANVVVDYLKENNII